MKYTVKKCLLSLKKNEGNCYHNLCIFMDNFEYSTKHTNRGYQIGQQYCKQNGIEMGKQGNYHFSCRNACWEEGNGTEPQNHACSIVRKTNTVLLVDFIFRFIIWSSHILIFLYISAISHLCRYYLTIDVQRPRLSGNFGAGTHLK